MDTTSTDYGTRADAHRYVTTALGSDVEDFDVEGITDSVRALLGHWHFDRMDDPDDPAAWDVDFWRVVARHPWPLSGAAVPGCPDWCQRDRGHDFELIEQDGTLVGYHEGRLGQVTDPTGSTIVVGVARQVQRTPAGTIEGGPMFATIDTDHGVQLTDPATVRDLGDMLRKAAALLDQN